jgi:hypothetical protein
VAESKNKNLLYALIAIGIVVVLFLVLIVAKSSNSSTNKSTGDSPENTTGSSPAPAAITQDLASVQQSTLDKIGLGTALSKPLPIKAPALTANSKPEILYEGAEFCPYCATERWAMGVALSKFGTFTNLKLSHSSTSDVYPNTQTISFYNSTYTSSYFTFTPIEIYTNIPSGEGYTTLQVPTAAENTIVQKYDATPYLPEGQAGSIPFIDFGGKYLIAGATYSPALLQGETSKQIAGSLNTPTSQVAKGVDGAANTMIASFCKLTVNQPATVCDTTIQKIEATL